jgi:hypothetical protein
MARRDETTRAQSFDMRHIEPGCKYVETLDVTTMAVAVYRVKAIDYERRTVTLELCPWRTRRRRLARMLIPSRLRRLCTWLRFGWRRFWWRWR